MIHIASVSRRVANTDYAAYASSKAALYHLVEVVALEWAPMDVTVNAIGPATVAQPMSKSRIRVGINLRRHPPCPVRRAQRSLSSS